MSTLLTRVTFRAVVDTILPEIPEIGAELVPEDVLGGLVIDLEAFLITYVDDGFQLGMPHLKERGNIPFADPIAQALDVAALKLLDRAENEVPPSDDHADDVDRLFIADHSALAGRGRGCEPDQHGLGARRPGGRPYPRTVLLSPSLLLLY